MSSQTCFPNGLFSPASVFPWVTGNDKGTNGSVLPFGAPSLACLLVPLLVASHCWIPLIKGKPSETMLGSWSLTFQTTQKGESALHPRGEG